MATATLISTINTNFRRPTTFHLKTPPLFRRQEEVVSFNSKPLELQKRISTKNASVCSASRRSTTTTDASVSELDDNTRRVLQFALWTAEGVYIIWLFLLPYAPGDPVWAISSDTINSLIGLSLNFFFILPLMNSVGINLIDAPVLHPMSEGLFNFVIGWTFMFAPLLFTDRNRDRYKGSLDVLWGFQMFLTNTFLIPYMAIRLNKPDTENTPKKASQLRSVMVNGAPVVGVVGGAACLISILWALYGRADGNFGGVADRWEFLVSYLGSERLAYAFIWDICLYIVFQPWLIGENLQNVEKSKVNLVKYVRFVPVLGLVAYILCLDVDEDV
ncbi:hypothetical protein HanRHA438_Chr17g0813481 [Helianthus annuus]|nr:hypothetical protein HanHA89_Chr17g0706931 [Helianthus annuus]KAJ0632483.1 hypothetical protein HanLR1_Chr17g0665621 [Helianthus annuus]KAJ0636324.1 hypothetical protein HanOQP8_Chr17g0660651 [Helianthus annuus]KAJ0667487.1 hypothetical protein HanPI659440_Chr17g0678351 [Helianthus annuus]KAJ0826364.1 hypothetical protein HanRHA438_Chr17g0813481 [Helianthus annuus]